MSEEEQEVSTAAVDERRISRFMDLSGGFPAAPAEGEQGGAGGEQGGGGLGHIDEPDIVAALEVGDLPVIAVETVAGAAAGFRNGELGPLGETGEGAGRSAD